MKRWAILALIVITLLGAGLRLFRLDEKSLWSDEVATIATSSGNSIDPEAFQLRGESFDPPQPIPAGDYRQKAIQSHNDGHLAQVAHVLKANVHPPLFFWLMSLWIEAFGLSEGVLRLPSAVFGILCVPVMAWLAWGVASLDAATQNQKSLFNDERSSQSFFVVLSAAFMAISAYQIDHAQDARQYTLLLLLAMLAVGLAVRIITHQKASSSPWPWIVLTGLLLAGLYTQYFFLNIVVLVFGILAWAGRRDRSFLTRILGMGLLIGMGMLPWWPFFKAQLLFLKGAGHYTAGLWKPLQLPEKLWRITCEFFMPDNALGKVMPLIVLLSAFGIAYRQRQSKAASSIIVPIGLGLLLAWLVAVMGGQVFIDLLKQSHTATIRRYLLLASPACYLLMAYGLVFIGKRLDNQRGWKLAGLLSALLCGLMLWDAQAQLLRGHTSSDEFKQAARWINKAAQPNDVVLVSKSGAMAVGMAYYLHPAIKMRGVDVPDYAALQDGSMLMRQLQDAIQPMPQRRIWLVFSHTAPSTRTRLADWLTQHGYQNEHSKKAPGVLVQQWTHPIPRAL